MHLLLALTTLTTLTSAVPLLTTTLARRAGGPAIVPIPSTCSLLQVRALSNQDVAPPAFHPAPALLTSQVYSWFTPTADRNATADYETCLQQCYGFGTRGTCKAVFFAEGYPADPQRGAQGGWPSNACYMFSREVAEGDFVVDAEGAWAGSVGVNIECPEE